MGFVTKCVNWPQYDGNLGDPKKMSPLAKRGYRTWANQCSKCNNPNLKDYKFYGGKGIRVEYTSNEFLGWWMYHVPRSGCKKPTVGRIDHSKNYCFSNIEIQEHSDNSLERVNRVGVFRQEKPILVYLHGKYINKFNCIKEASLAIGISVTTISKLCKGTYLTSKGFKKSTNNGYSFKFQLSNLSKSRSVFKPSKTGRIFNRLANTSLL